MRKTCNVLLNGERFTANCGDLLLDAALMRGIEIPHDCRSGYCGTCRVKVVEGRTFGGEDGSADAVRACQSRVLSDLKIEIEDVPDTVVEHGQVVDLVRLAPTVVEVCIALPNPLEFRPGQYCKVQFRGFPARCYSPTFPLEGVHETTVVRFHISQVPNGRVSQALFRKIQVGHRVKLTGPLGTAFYRPEHRGRMVLVAAGTGFAPIWSIALAALYERRDREMILIVGARNLPSLYMARALCKLAPFRNVTIVPVVSERQSFSGAVRTGRPTDYMPALSSSDVVYTCGAPPMVEAVGQMAKAVGARCYMDAFDAPSRPAERKGLLHRATAWFTGDEPALAPEQLRMQQAPAQRPARAPASPPRDPIEAWAPRTRAHAV